MNRNQLKISDGGKAGNTPQLIYWTGTQDI